ncbi:MAG: GyrI-like domain-containing protein [candidate division WOR-3 bacterium]
MSNQMLRIVVAIALAIVILGCGQKKVAEKPKPEAPKFTATVEKLDAMSYAAINSMGPYDGVGEAMKRLMSWTGTAKVQPSGAPFGLFYDDPAKVKPESLRWSVCVPVPDGTKPDKKAGVEIKRLEPSEIAVTVHVGPSAGAGPTYAELAKWIAEQNLEVAGPAIEFYLSPPTVTPESLKTKVGFFVKAKAPTAPAETAKKEEKKEEVPGGKPPKTGR